MRKFCAVLLLILFLAGCGESEKLQVAKAGYSMDAVITVSDTLNLTARCTVLGGGIFKTEITSPKSLKGITAEFSGEEGKITYNGGRSAPPINLEYGGVLSLLNGAFLKLSTGGPNAVRLGEEWVYTERYKTAEFCFTLNEDGLPTRLVYKNNNLEAEFLGWSYQKNG